MSFFVYLFVLLVAASSVLFGLDWMQAPLQPPARTPSAAFTAAPVQPAAASTSSAVADTIAAASAPAVALTGAPAAEAPTGTTPASDLKVEEREKQAAPLCDIDACERAYRSFTAADCTYQPSWGARRLCTKGRRPAAQNAAKEASAQARCNVSACESAYQSFDAATCTYQSYGGGRRLCTR
jgi:hypothetical protein